MFRLIREDLGESWRRFRRWLPDNVLLVLTMLTVASAAVYQSVGWTSIVNATMLSAWIWVAVRRLRRIQLLENDMRAAQYAWAESNDRLQRIASAAQTGAAEADRRLFAAIKRYEALRQGMVLPDEDRAVTRLIEVDR